MSLKERREAINSRFTEELETISTVIIIQESLEIHKNELERIYVNSDFKKSPVKSQKQVIRPSGKGSGHFLFIIH